MGAPGAAELLTAWERGRVVPQVERALLLLAAAEPEATMEGLAGLTIGRRDARLLRLRECIFGSSLQSVTSCPSCGESLELDLEVGDLLRDAERGGGGAGEGPFLLETQGCSVHYRLPTSADLMAVAATDEAAHALLERCVEQVAGEETGLSAELAAAVMTRMAEVDPAAALELTIRCPVCHAEWLSPFDIVSYFWSEIDAWAWRTLHEVHLLARAYGWSEAGILSLSPQRRLAYLAMVGS